uniref:Zinc transporter ZIP9 n=1 Tax=Elaeophora elaphi TaxID=1147741 RepID=A0A0R3S2L3_9BILA
MDGFYLLLYLSISMFVGSFLAGLVPLAFNISEVFQGRARLLSTFGAGLLVGTALSVIIPEGIEALYIVHIGTLFLYFSLSKHLPEAVHNEDINRIVLVNQQDVSNSLKQPTASSLNGRMDYLTGFGKNDVSKEIGRQIHQIPVMEKKETDEHGHFEAPVNFSEINQSVGYSLVVGFLFMFLIDQISRFLSSKGGDRSQFKVTATIGLVVHATADGVAFGSASATNRTDVQFIVFLAIMLHKAPAAFGLVTFLLVEGIERFRIRRHLTIFSVAAPVGAIVTYFLIAAAESDKFSADSATGTLMLFSAGTFLYVATVHILPELIGSSVKDYQLANSVTESSNRGGNEARTSLKLIELISIVVGAISPTFLVSKHSHSH